MSISGIKKCVVTGVKDSVLRTVPKVHIILEEEFIGKEQDIQNSINTLIYEKIGADSVPRYYSFDREFLYTGSGKVDYKKMEEKDNEELEETQKVLRKII